MVDLGFESCKADPDVWMRARVRDEDHFEYYEYVLIYVDDIMCISHDPKGTMDKIDHFFPMKPGSVAEPDLYLGAKISKVTLDNGVHAWAMSSSKYVQEAVRNVENWIVMNRPNFHLPTKVTAPIQRGYRPECDVSPELGPEDSSYYASIIGILRWAVELGRFDITTEISMLAAHLALPREGHLMQAFHAFAYLKIRHSPRMAFDPTYPVVDEERFKEVDWSVQYGEIKEAMPPKMPQPRGKEVVLRCYVDSDHAGDVVTRRSRTGYLIFMNGAPIDWYSKKQGSVETSTFGSEFVANKMAMEKNRGLRYKLRMMGVPISGPTYGFGDNMSVIHNVTKPESTLKKKSNAICYHAVREAVAMGELTMTHEPGVSNPADLMTKAVPGGLRRDELCRFVLMDY
jgi:hypothetical protein